MLTQNIPLPPQVTGETGRAEGAGSPSPKSQEQSRPGDGRFKAGGSFSTRQLPSWAEEGWVQYQSQRAAGRLKEASDILTKIRKQAVLNGVQSFKFPSAVMIQEGEEAFSKGKLNEAVEMGEVAKEWSPNDSTNLFFLAKAQFHNHPLSPMTAISSYLQGLSAGIGDFWFVFYATGRTVLILLAGLFGGFIAFFILLLVRYLPLLVHSLYELLSGIFNPLAIWVLVVTVLMLPFIVGVGAGYVLLIGICLVWLYMTHSERIVAVFFVLVLAFSNYWLPLMLTWLTADQSTELALLSDVLLGDAAATGTAQLMEAQGGYDRNWPVLLSLAIQKRREGNLSEALDRYLNLKKLDPNRGVVLNNIGNIYFLMKQYDEAVSYYKQALEKDPRDAVGHYNLSLVYRDLLRFNDAKQEIDAAQQLNLSLIESNQGAAPIDELFSQKNLWITAFSKSTLKEGKTGNLIEGMLSPLSSSNVLILPVLFSGGLIVMRLLISRKVTAADCALCGRPICFHCQRRILDQKTCSHCWNGSKNVKRKADLRQLKIRQRWILKMARWSSVFLPGAGHLYFGRGIRGLVFSALFIGMVFTLFFRNHFYHLPAQRGGFLGVIGTLVLVIGFAFLYIFVHLDLVRGPQEKS